MTNINHVFFDLDHTLWDFDRNSALTFEKIFQMNNVDLPLDDFLKVYEPINFAYWKLYREQRVSKSDLRYGRLRDAFDALNFYPDDVLIYELSEAYIEHLTTVNFLFEGTIEILEYLKKSYALHIITNGFEEAQIKKLKNSKIEGFFKTVTNSEMVGVKKPNPKIFNFALKAANAKAHQSVMIGDSIEADIEGAEGVGMQTVFFDSKDEIGTYSKLKINKLEQLKQLL